ncbi:trypsin-like peptidase domain-containing protein, partial [Singulisphaera rosea]
GMLAFSSLGHSRPADAAGPETPAVAPPKTAEDSQTTSLVSIAREEKHNAPLWQSVVRLSVLNETGVGYATGTVIDTRNGESIVLTCAHAFKLQNRLQVPPAEFPHAISVTLFGGEVEPLPNSVDKPAGWLAEQMIGGSTPRGLVHSVGGSTPGKLIDYDFARDVALVRLPRPHRNIPASPIMPKSWKWSPTPGMPMITMGCSLGGDATFWGTTVRNPLTKGLADNPVYEAIECSGAPAQGRSGGGLFSIGGNLAGVCNFAEPKGDVGLYATLDSIYTILDRNGLSSLYRTPEEISPPAPTIEPPASEELETQLRLATKQIERNDRLQARETLSRLEHQIRARREALQAALLELDTKYTTRLEHLNRAAKDFAEPSQDVSTEQGLTPPRTDSAPIKPSSDQERRLERVEQTLGHVLKTLEELKPVRRNPS